MNKTNHPDYRTPTSGPINEYQLQVIEGRLLVRDKRDGESSLTEHKQFEPWMLRETIQVKNTTFGQFWKLIEPDMDMWNIVFKGDTHGNDLTAWVGVMEEDYDDPDEDDSKIDYITVYHGIERWTYQGRKEFYTTNGFGAYGMVTHFADEDDVPGAYGIGFSSIRWMKNFPFYIDETFHFTNLDSIKNYQADRGEKQWILMDVLGEIFFEITFHGTPEKTKEFGDQLIDQVERIESGEEELIPWEELKEKLKEKIDF